MTLRKPGLIPARLLRLASRICPVCGCIRPPFGFHSMSDLSLDQKPQGWDAVASGYEKVFEYYAGLFAQELLAQVKPRPGHRVIDIGAGPGILTMLAAPSGADLLGIDFSPSVALRAKRHLRRRLVEPDAGRMADAGHRSCGSSAGS